MPQVSAAVLRSTPSSTRASASIRRAAALFFSPLAALRSSEAVRSSRVTDTAAPIDAAPLQKPASSQSFTDLGIPNESQFRAVGIRPSWGASSFQESILGIMGSRFRGNDGGEFLFHLRKPIVERVAGAAHGADRVLLAARIEQFAQPPDMHIHGALVDIDVAAPDAVEQLLAAEHPSRMLEKKFQQPIFGRAEIDGAAR